MRKSAAAGGAVVVLAAAWLGATWYTGKRLEAESPARIAAINQRFDEALPGYGMKLEQLGFERGFFSSHARYGLSMTGLGHAANQPLLPSGVIEIDVQADHGPFPLKALAHGNVLPKLAYVHAELARTDKLQPWFDAAKGKAPVSSDEVIAYNGDSSGTLDIAPTHFEDGSGKLDFSGATMQGSYTQSTQAVQTVLQMASLAVDVSSNPSANIKGARLRIEGVSLKLERHLGMSKLSVGSHDLSIKHAEAKVVDGPPMQLELDDMDNSGESSQTGDTLNIQGAFRVGGLKINSVDLGNGQYAVKLAGLNSDAVYNSAQVFSRLQSKLRQQAASRAKDQGQSGDAGKAGSNLDPVELITALQPALAGSPTLSIDPLVWKTDKGEGRLVVNLNLTQPPASALQGPAQAFWLQALKSVDAKLTLSQPMMRDLTARYMTGFRGVPADQADRQAAQQINGLAVMGQMTGLVRTEGDNLVSDFHYADGKMLINGHDPKLGALLNPVQ